MQQTLIHWFTTALGGYLSKEGITFFISMVPILELRGGLIAAALFKIPLAKAIIICFLGNMVPIPFILWLITPIFAWLKKRKLFRPAVEKLEKKAMGKSDTIQKYEFWGLLFFVGIPLPGTGAWTGALIASLLEMKGRKAFLAILCGMVVATFIMCMITYFIPWVLRMI